MGGMAHIDELLDVGSLPGSLELPVGDLHFRKASAGIGNTQMDSMIVQQHLEMRDNSLGENFFDPISSVEYVLSLQIAGNEVDCSDASLYTSSMRTKSNAAPKKPRGRPKRIHSLPEPLFVPSTPSKSQPEALETWNTAKLLGVKASNEGKVLSALRKSKRLLFLEEHNPSG